MLYLDKLITLLSVYPLLITLEPIGKYFYYLLYFHTYPLYGSKLTFPDNLRESLYSKESRWLSSLQNYLLFVL